MAMPSKPFMPYSSLFVSAPLLQYAHDQHLNLLEVTCNQICWLCCDGLSPEIATNTISLAASISGPLLCTARYDEQTPLYEQSALLLIEQELRMLLLPKTGGLVTEDGLLHIDGQQFSPLCSALVGPEQICISLFAEGFIALIYPDNSQYISTLI